MNDTKKIYNYEGVYEACWFAESLGHQSIDEGEQAIADLHEVKSFEDVPEHYQCGFIDEFEYDALEFIRAKGYTILEDGEVLE